MNGRKDAPKPPSISPRLEPSLVQWLVIEVSVAPSNS
jgi:hypothetical protein